MSTKAPRVIVVDDSDTRIHYTNDDELSWFSTTDSGYNVGCFGGAYKGTMRGTKSNGNISFSFEGTTIKVFGTVDTTGEQDKSSFVSWECFVDKASMGIFRLPSSTGVLDNNMLLCGQDALSAGPHELTMAAAVNGGTLWVDYLQYTPTAVSSTSKPSSSLSDVPAFLVDSNDPDITYYGVWQNIGGSTSMAAQNGSSVKFTFQGAKLSWFGAIPQAFPSSSSSSGTYAIDNNPSISFSIPQNTTSAMYNQLFFSTSDLTPGIHDLLVTYSGSGNINTTTPLSLDHLIISTTSTNHPSKHANISAIVGGTLGGLVFVSLALLVGFVWYRRSYIGLPKSSASEIEITPFVIPAASSFLGSSSSTFVSVAGPKHRLFRPFIPALTNPTPMQEMRKERCTSHASAIQSASTSLGAQETTVGNQPSDPGSVSESARVPVQHLDSGIRMGDTGMQRVEEVEEVPPVYRAD